MGVIIIASFSDGSSFFFSFLTFGLSGCYIFYNTNVLNEYTNSDETEESQAEYEKKERVSIGEIGATIKVARGQILVDFYTFTR